MKKFPKTFSVNTKDLTWLFSSPEKNEFRFFFFRSLVSIHLLAPFGVTPFFEVKPWGEFLRNMSGNAEELGP